MLEIAGSTIVQTFSSRYAIVLGGYGPGYTELSQVEVRLRTEDVSVLVNQFTSFVGCKTWQDLQRCNQWYSASISKVNSIIMAATCKILSTTCAILALTWFCHLSMYLWSLGGAWGAPRGDPPLYMKKTSMSKNDF